MAYADLLKNPRWQQKRLRILDRDNWTCQWCGDKETTLHVHHKKYAGGKPWEIDDKFLITFCESCHNVEENLKNQKLVYVAGLTGLSSRFIFDLSLVISFIKSERNNEYKKVLNILNDLHRNNDGVMTREYESFLKDDLNLDIV